MPGTFVVKPIEATLTGAVTLGAYSRGLDPYCEVKIGRNCVYSNPSKELGSHPHWDEELIIQKGGDSKCKVILKDQNKQNPNRDIGEANIDLNQITTKGHVLKWFDINKGHRKQGQILLDVTYTEANPRSRTFHNSIKEGTAIAGNSRDQIYHDIENHSGVDPEYRQKFIEATKHPKFFNQKGHTPQNDKVVVKDYSEHKKSGKLYEGKDPTLMNTKIKPGTANTGMSNPNTMKLGVNHHHPAENIPIEHIPLEPNEHQRPSSTYPTANELISHNPRLYQGVPERDSHCRHQHHGRVVELPEGPVKGPWNAKDPTINHTRVKPGSANSGMSNPNTMKLGVNHDLPRDHVHFEEIPETVDPHPRIHHYGRKVDLPEGPTKGPWDVRDPTINHTRVKPGSANSGMSNPNTMKLGVNHDLPRDHVHFEEIPETVDPHPRIHHYGRKVDLPEGPTKGPWQVRDPTINHTKVRPGTSNTGMSNPNTMKLGVNHHYPAENIPVDEIPLNPHAHYYDHEDPQYYDGQDYDAPHEVVQHHPKAHYSGRKVDVFEEPTTKFSQPKKTILKKDNGRPGSAHYGVNHNVYPEAPVAGAGRDPTLRNTRVRPGTSNSGMSNPNTMKLGVNHHVEHNEDQRFSPVVDTITDAAPRGRYSRRSIDEDLEVPVHGGIRDPTLRNTTVKPYSSNTGMSNPNTAKLGVSKAPVYYDPSYEQPAENYVVMERAGHARDRHNQPFEPATGHINHGPYQAAHGPEDLSDTGMSNPNMIGLDYQRLRGLKNAQEQLANQRRVQGLQESAHHHAYEIDKITTSNDTSLGCYKHPQHLVENGMSDPNNARYGFNHHIERPSTGSSRHGYTTAEHTNPLEVDKITTINDTTLGRQRDLAHVWDSGMSDPHAIIKGVNHADVRRKESWESRGSIVKREVGPYEVDKITSVHDIRLSKNKNIY